LEHGRSFSNVLELIYLMVAGLTTVAMETTSSSAVNLTTTAMLTNGSLRLALCGNETLWVSDVIGLDSIVLSINS